MGQDKKKVIAGVGGTFIGIGVARLLIGRRPPQKPTCTPGETECRGNDLYECNAQGQWKRKEKNSPSCIVNPTGCLQGYVLNQETGAKVPHGNAQITIDGTQAIYNIVDELGGYRTPYLLHGMHHFTVEANNFVTGEFDIEITKPVSNFSFELEPLPPGPPGEWSEGVEVQSVSVEPVVAYPGETVNINAYIQYGIHDPDKYPTPATICGTVKVNGQELRDEFDIDFRNPTLRFSYMASQIGEFTAIAQDKSAKFTVVKKPVATYYFPYGGERIPRCVQFVIPDGWSYISTYPAYAGQDLVLGVDSLINQEIVGFFPSRWNPIFAHLTGVIPKEIMLNGYPTKWEPPSVTVTEYELYWSEGSFKSGMPGIAVIPLAWDFCPPYWNDKAKLAEIIAQPLYDYMNLGGRTKKFNIFGDYLGMDPVRGIQNLVKTKLYTSSAFQGHVDAKLHCPYCSGGITWGNRSPIPYLDMARKLLEHIENDHPDHPLTEPAWF